jgi:hypothetical protein
MTTTTAGRRAKTAGLIWRSSWVLALAICGACEPPPDAEQPQETPTGDRSLDPSIEKTQSEIGFFCAIQTASPSFWAAVTRVSSDKENIPLPTSGNHIPSACNEYLTTTPAGLALLALFPATADCACRYVCGNGYNDTDNGQCGACNSDHPSWHTTCQAGAPLRRDCSGRAGYSAAKHTIVTIICDNDPFCCNTAWDQLCVDHAWSLHVCQ